MAKAVGRPRSLDYSRSQKAKALYIEGRLSAHEIADRLGISRATFFRYRRDWKISVLRIGIEDFFGVSGSRYLDFSKGCRGHHRLDCELIKELRGRMDQRVELIPTPWDKVFESIKSGKVDLMFASLANSPSRQTQFLFSEPYTSFAGVKAWLVGRKEFANQPFESLNLVLGVPQNSQHEMFFDQHLKFPWRKAYVPNEKRISHAFASGEIHVALVCEVSFAFELEQLKDVCVWRRFDYNVQTCVMMDHDNLALKHDLDLRLEQLRRETALERLNGEFLFSAYDYKATATCESTR